MTAAHRRLDQLLLPQQRKRPLRTLAGRDIREQTGVQDLAMALTAVVGDMQFVLPGLVGIAERAGSGRR